MNDQWSSHKKRKKSASLCLRDARRGEAQNCNSVLHVDVKKLLYFIGQSYLLPEKKKISQVAECRNVGFGLSVRTISEFRQEKGQIVVTPIDHQNDLKRIYIKNILK